MIPLKDYTDQNRKNLMLQEDNDLKHRDPVYTAWKVNVIPLNQPLQASDAATAENVQSIMKHKLSILQTFSR